MPGPADPERLAANVAASDERDAPRSLEEVEGEVFERSGGNESAEAVKTQDTEPPASSADAAAGQPESQHKGDA